MKKINFRRQNPLTGLKELYSRRPYSAVFIALSTLVCAVYVYLEEALSYDEWRSIAFGLFEDLFLVLLLVTVGVILTENLFPKLKGIGKAAAMLPALLIGFVLTAAVSEGEFLPAPGLAAYLNRTVDSLWIGYLFGYFIVAAALTLWSCWRNSGVDDFSAYTLRVFIRIALDALVLDVVLIGLVLLNGIVLLLLWDDADIVMLSQVGLVFGLWFIPNAACAMLRGADEPPRFAVALVRRVLLGLCTAAYVILFVYILKIIVTWTFPKNTVFGMCTVLFYISMPVALMSLNESANDLWHRLARILPPLFLPFAAMQALCIGMRISQYGLTTSRYIAVAQILFECIFCVRYAFDRRTVSRMLPVLAVMTGLCLLAPELNCNTLPDVLQAKTLRAGLAAEIETLSDREISRLNAAVGYDGSAGRRDRWREAYFSTEEIEKIEALGDRLHADHSDRVYTKRIYTDTPSAYPLSLEGYRQLYGVIIEGSMESDEAGGLELTALPMKPSSEGSYLPKELKTVDLSEMVEAILAMEEEAPGIRHKYDPELILPDGSLLRFTSFRINVNEYNGEVRYVHADALLLVK